MFRRVYEQWPKVQEIGRVGHVYDVLSLQQALGRMSPRLAQVLLRRFVEHRSRDEFGALYGLQLEQADRLVYRASRSLEAALAGMPEPGPMPDRQEIEQTHALLRAQPPFLTALSAQHEALSVALEQAAREAESSPARAREEWLRRIAIVLVLALAGYFYWRDHFGPKERRPPEPRSGATR